jgi:hypothetical protein
LIKRTDDCVELLLKFGCAGVDTEKILKSLAGFLAGKKSIPSKRVVTPKYRSCREEYSSDPKTKQLLISVRFV